MQVVSGPIGRERARYQAPAAPKLDDMLEATQNAELDIMSWPQWFLGCLDRAFDGAGSMPANVLRKARFWEKHSAVPINDRRSLT
jgi:hypothetical protein